MRVLFAASESFPYAKSGGLADVADALPQALSEHIFVARVIPLYGFFSKKSLHVSYSFTLSLGKKEYEIKVYEKSGKKVPTYFVYAPYLSDTQKLYGDENGDYPDNDLRFALFSMAIVELCNLLKIDLLHLNDWHTALAALFIKEKKLPIKTVFTIHNLAYQGIFDASRLQLLGIDTKYFTLDGIEFYGKINFLKAAIAYSDHITTVSPSYAKEILTPEFGCGLEGFLRYHQAKLTGILNGINAQIYNPKKDSYLVAQYDAKTLDEKYKNKVEFIKNSTLKDPRKPLVVMITRLVGQKGIDMILDLFEQIVEQKINLFILGEGEVRYIQKLSGFAEQFDNFAFFDGFDEQLSHQVYAAADFLLMPSTFEPCGLNQMIAMAYGTVPLVRKIGGLKDSVHEDSLECGRGFVFEKESEFIACLFRALKLSKQKEKLLEMIQWNMQCDFSFKQSALEYLKIYQRSGDE